ncbi:hypothetical protein [Blastococcus atacamensis]|uniref:hypothetical protein n=1 Tax=Blastococcus atacamensis TaxID=2070508 RepID=UPI000CEBE3D2|nr:hypothetical protein [Blastococcus atacamensis]
MSDPWADPSAPAEPGYTGPPPTARPPWPAPYGGPAPYGVPPYGVPPYGVPAYGVPAYGVPPYGVPPYGMPPYGSVPFGPPRPPDRPGQVVGAAVLAFVQGALVLIASFYVWFFASVAAVAIDENPTGAPTQAYQLQDLGTTLTIVQVLSVVLLVVGGILALTRRVRTSWLVLVAAHAVQLLLTGYWAVRLQEILGRVEELGGVLAVFALFFAAFPLVALGLVLLGPGRRWFTAPQG